MVAGAAAAELRRRTGGLRTDFRPHADDMPDLMARADLAVSAGGSTCWEMAYMGLPNLVLVLADNQRPIAERLAAAGVSLNLGDARRLDPADLAAALDDLVRDRARRRAMAAAGRTLIDGRGAERVLDSLPMPAGEQR